MRPNNSSVIVYPLVGAVTVGFSACVASGYEPGLRATVRRSAQETTASHSAGAAAFDSKRAGMIIFGAKDFSVKNAGAAVLTTYDPAKD